MTAMTMLRSHRQPARRARSEPGRVARRQAAYLAVDELTRTAAWAQGCGHHGPAHALREAIATRPGRPAIPESAVAHALAAASTDGLLLVCASASRGFGSADAQTLRDLARAELTARDRWA